MRRRLFTLASALSLLLCAATAVLWIRSLVRVDNFDGVWTNHEGAVATYAATSNAGHFGVCLTICDEPQPWAQTYRLRHSTAPAEPGGLLSGPMGFSYLNFSTSRLGWRDATGENHLASTPGVLYAVTIPYWATLTLAGVLPLADAWRRWRTRRATCRRVCATCGYDLRASPDRCPECGAPKSRKVRLASE